MNPINLLKQHSTDLLLAAPVQLLTVVLIFWEFQVPRLLSALLAGAGEAFAVAAQRAGGEVRVGDIANVATSFPDFDTLATGAGFALRNA